MSFVRIPGGIWTPHIYTWGITDISAMVDLTLDADEEEIQIIGTVSIAGGATGKTFGTGGSKIEFATGTPITFADDGASDPTLRVGIKKASTIDAANGPPGRATIGAATFDVYDDLTGGTDTISAVTWTIATMSAGTPFTVNNGDQLAVCFHLNKPGAAAQSVLIRSADTGFPEYPSPVLVTSGPTYTQQSVWPNVVIVFDDGTIGWLTNTFAVSANAVTAIGNGVILGNIINYPFGIKVDAIRIQGILGAGTTNLTAGIWSTPLGTPAAVTDGTVSVDPQNLISAVGARGHTFMLPAEVELAASTDFAAGVKQNSATALSVVNYSVNTASHLEVNGLDATCYAATSTAGAAFAALNSGKTRGLIFVRISHVDIPAGAAGGVPMSRIQTGM